MEQETPEAARSIEEEKAQSQRKVVASARVLALQQRLGMQGLEDAGGVEGDGEGEGHGGERDGAHGEAKIGRARRRLSLGHCLEGTAGRQAQGGSLVSRAWESLAAALHHNCGWPLGTLIVAVGAVGASIVLRHFLVPAQIPQ